MPDACDPAQSRANAVASLAASMASLDRTTQASLHISEDLRRLQRRMGFFLGLAVLLAPLAVLALGWQGWIMYQQNQALHAQTRAIVQTNQALLGELLQRTPPR